jgi:hypothetical protein
MEVKDVGDLNLAKDALPMTAFKQCFFYVFSHVEIQTANHFLSPKFSLLWFF